MRTGINHIRTNFALFYTEDIKIWFSYETPVAFQIETGKLIVRCNEWGPTTARHLNAIDGGGSERLKARVSSKTFERLATEAGL